ncbi:MAG: TIGR04255 family protein [Burkholderiales bacterium]
MIKSNLPNAPLSEVIFEYRWPLTENVHLPEHFRGDPGYQVFADKFEGEVSALGFVHLEKVAKGPFPQGYGVDRRFYKAKGQIFPLFQIGPGIFAANESSMYEWKTYRDFCLRGIKCMIESYPVMEKVKVRPRHLELRYIDTFEYESGKRNDFLAFLINQTTFKVECDATSNGLASLLGQNVSNGQVSLVFDTQLPQGGKFHVTVGTGEKDTVPVVRLQTKVVSSSEQPFYVEKTPSEQTKYVRSWLDAAHEITSAFFKSFVRPELMQKFRGAEHV